MRADIGLSNDDIYSCAKYMNATDKWGKPESGQTFPANVSNHGNGVKPMDSYLVGPTKLP
jgi:hypothetical protein